MTTLSLPRQLGLRVCGLFAAFAMTAAALNAQAPAPRIRAEISNSNLSLLKGSLLPLAQPDLDAGRMPANTTLHGMSIVFNRSAAQQADLDALLAAQQTPSSPLYHQWLNPDQFAARFGMAQSDLDKVQTWLEQQGFSIDSVARSRNLVRFSGTTGQVEQAFQTQMHYYTLGGEKHFAPSTALSMPSALAATVAAVTNLNDIRPRPMFKRSDVLRAQPAYTSGQSGNVFFTPGDIKVAYHLNPLLATYNGAGQSIAVMGQSSVVVGDIENFQNAAGLSVKDPTLVLVPGSGASQVFSGDEGESDLDLEWSGGVATGANILFVYTGSNTNFGVFDSIQYAIDEKLATIITISYGACEAQLGSGNYTALETIMAQGAAQGQTIIASSGDSGSTSCYGISSLTAAQQEVVSVSYPASSSYVTAVGGTEITSANDASGNQYWAAETAGTDIITSALKYIPEVAWNDSLASGQAGNGLSSTGGGVSIYSPSKPSWQTGVVGIPADSFRDVPDVALYSSPDLPGYLYCTSDQGNWVNLQQASCNSGFRDSATGDLTIAGGTSFAAPIFAGMAAVLAQAKGAPAGLGFLNPELYTLASNGATYAAAFHDITTGNNECPSSLGATFCSSTSGGETKYTTNTGYDPVTGLGSVDLTALATAWPNSTSTLIGTTTGVTASSASPNTGVNDTFTVTVTSNTGSTTPSGAVNIVVDGGTAIPETLTGNGTFQYTTSFATAGVHSVVALYAGDSTHAASTGTVSVSVQGSSSGGGTFSLSATNVTVNAGSSGTSTVTVTPASGYTGTVSFSVGTTSTISNACYSISNATVSGASAVTSVLTFFTNSTSCAGAASKPGSGKPLLTNGTRYKVASAPPAPTPNSTRQASFGFIALLMAGFLGWRFRKIRALAAIVALAALGLSLTACGGGGSSSGGGGGGGTNAAKGTYTMTVTGTDTTTSSITASTTLTLKIQ